MKKIVDKKNWTRYNETLPHKTAIERKKKKEKKVLTERKRRDKLTELRQRERPTQNLDK